MIGLGLYSFKGMWVMPALQLTLEETCTDLSFCVESSNRYK